MHMSGQISIMCTSRTNETVMTLTYKQIKNETEDKEEILYKRELYQLKLV